MSSAGPGSVASSRSFWYGIGCDGAPTRTTGASSSQKLCSAICAAISAPKPPNWTASCATTTRCVLATDAAIVSVSSGTSVLGSTTSTLIPSGSRSRATRSAWGTVAPRATIVTSVRRGRCAPVPSSIAYRSSGTGTGSPKKRSFCSRKITGLSSWIAAARSPFASKGFDGITTTSPGMWAKSASRLWECWAPRRTPPPDGIRITRGTFGVPPIMKRSFAAWLRIWSNATPAKSENCSSTTGRSPVRAAPMPQPTKPLSVSGVSRIRAAPYFSYRSSVARNSPPTRPMSSPITITSGSAPSSRSSASRIAATKPSSRPAGAGGSG